MTRKDSTQSRYLGIFFSGGLLIVAPFVSTVIGWVRLRRLDIRVSPLVPEIAGIAVLFVLGTRWSALLVGQWFGECTRREVLR